MLPDLPQVLSALAESDSRIYLADGRIQNVAVHLGFVEVGGDHVTILSDAAELEVDIDVARARAAMTRAEEQLRKEHTSELEADLRRAHARLSAAGGLGATAH